MARAVTRKRKDPAEVVAKATEALTPERIGDQRQERVCRFIEQYVPVAEGALIGQQMKLLPEQRHYIRDVYGSVDDEGKRLARRGILSVGRKNGKTGLISGLVLAHSVGPEAIPHSQAYSAARSRDQASLVFNYCVKSILQSPVLSALVHVQPTRRAITGLRSGVSYRALAADATTSYGLSPAVTIHDELGQVVGPTDALYDALETAGGAQKEPLSHIISTQAPGDADLLSLLIDDALRSGDPRTVCHLYAIPKDADVFAPENWVLANFALDKFRSRSDLQELAERAQRMPSSEATFRNLYCNQRVAAQALFIAPTTWREALAPPYDDEVLRSNECALGLDLSARFDLTAAVFSARDALGRVHLRTIAFTPAEGLEERAKLDRVPYQLWVEQGSLVALPGRSIEYGAVVEWLQEHCGDYAISRVCFDRWRIDQFRAAAQDRGFADFATWESVGQGFKDMAPRLDLFEELLTAGNLRLARAPALTAAAGGAVVAYDAARNRKLEKMRSSTRIDPLVAAIMSVAGHFVEKKSSVSSDSLLLL